MRNIHRPAGRIRQKRPYYRLDVPLHLQTAEQTIKQTVRLEADQAPFSVTSSLPPQVLQLDPEVHLFRRLAAAETPVAVNTLKGAEKVGIVISPRLQHSGTKLARRLSMSLGLKNTTIAASADSGWPATIWIGLPASTPQWLAQAAVFSAGQRSFTGVFGPNNRPVALFLPADDRPSAEAVAVKITHYGKYSYLVFDGVENQDKGTWPVEDSPVVVIWPR